MRIIQWRLLIMHSDTDMFIDNLIGISIRNLVYITSLVASKGQFDAGTNEDLFCWPYKTVRLAKDALRNIVGDRDNYLSGISDAAVLVTLGCPL